MKTSRCELHRSVHKLPSIRFEDQEMTSFSGLVLFQKLFASLRLRERLHRCVRHLESRSCYGPTTVLLWLVVHLVLGWRSLRDLVHYQGDPLVLRVLGLRRLPTVPTVCRELQRMGAGVVQRLRRLLRDLVVERLKSLGTRSITLDFDGSVFSTKSRKKEGTAVGFNRKSKGSHSYYPLFATVAQTDQVFDVLHRPGNVHDSRDALPFVQRCFQHLRQKGLKGPMEARLDSAHFSDETCFWLFDQGIQFTISVPFERFPQLKRKIQERQRWTSIDDTWSCFEGDWCPKKWEDARGHRRFRLLLFRQRVKTPKKGPIQLDLFQPVDTHYEYTAVITNKPHSAHAVLHFHHGRGSQEHLFGEIKSQGNLGYLPTRRQVGNEIYTLCSALACNLQRELLMRATKPQRSNALKRHCLWVFDTLGSFRKALVQRAGRLTRPNGDLALTVALNNLAATDFMHYLKAA